MCLRKKWDRYYELKENDISLWDAFIYKLYFKYMIKGSRIYATLPRSGFSYSMLTINVAYDLSMGNNGEYEYVNSAWKSNVQLNTVLDISCMKRKNDIKNPNIIIIHQTHLPFNKINNLIKNNKIILLIRNLFDQLESRLFHAGYGIEKQDKYLRDGYVCRSIDFLNSWGDYINNGKRVHVVKYEDLVSDSLNVIRSMCMFWHLNIEDKYITEALKLTTKDNMHSKLNEKDINVNPRVSFRKKKNVFNKSSKEFINKKIKNNLKYNFGYSY